MIDDPEFKAELIYGLDISELDPYSPEFQQTARLICLCRLYDRFHKWLLPVEHNALLIAIEHQCELTGVPFASLALTPKDEGDWRERIATQPLFHLPCPMPQSDGMDEEIARRIAERILVDSGLVLRRGTVFHDGDVWRFPTRLASEPDVPFDGKEMTVMVRVGPEDRLN